MALTYACKPTELACQIMAVLFHGLRVLSLIMIGITIFGINDASLSDLLGVLAAAMFIPLLLMIFGGFACDIQKQNNLNNDPTRSK